MYRFAHRQGTGRPAWTALLLVELAAGQALAATLPAPPTSATNGVPRLLTLAEAHQQAFAKNWDLLAAHSDVDLATAQSIIAREFPNPSVSLSTSKINTDAQPSNTPLGNSLIHRNYDTITAINQLFEIGGKRFSRRASAAAGYRGALARLQDARRVLALGVSQAYIAAVLAEDNVQILKQSARSLRQEAEIAAIRLKAGDISESDQRQIEIAAARLELEAKTAETAAAAGRIAVEVLLGVEHPTGSWRPGDSLDALAQGPVSAPAAAVGAARPDLLAAEANLSKANADLRLQKAVRIPDPTFLVQYERQPPDQPNTIGLGFSFPLPLWNRNRGAIRAAKAVQEQAAIQVAKVRAQIVAEIATAELGYQDALRRWERYRREIRPQSARVRETVAYAYQKGGASLVDLLTAERNDNEIRLATARAQADMAIATATLKAARNFVTEPQLTHLN